MFVERYSFRLRIGSSGPNRTLRSPTRVLSGSNEGDDNGTDVIADGSTLPLRAKRNDRWREHSARQNEDDIGRGTATGRREARPTFGIDTFRGGLVHACRRGGRRSNGRGSRGRFHQGSDGDAGFPEDGAGPARDVFADAFHAERYAVTNAEFYEFVTGLGYTTGAEEFGWSLVFEDVLPGENERHSRRRVAGTPWWIAVRGSRVPSTRRGTSSSPRRGVGCGVVLPRLARPEDARDGPPRTRDGERAVMRGRPTSVTSRGATPGGRPPVEHVGPSTGNPRVPLWSRRPNGVLRVERATVRVTDPPAVVTEKTNEGIGRESSQRRWKRSTMSAKSKRPLPLKSYAAGVSRTASSSA